MIKMFFAATLLAVAVACTPMTEPEAAAPVERDREAVRGEISALRDAYKAAAEAGDAAAISQLYAEDAVLLPATGGRFEGRAEIQGNYEATFAQGAVAFSAEPRSFELDGDVAIEDGVVTFSITPEGGEAQQVQAEYLVVSREIDGEWKILRLQSKPVAPPAM